MHAWRHGNVSSLLGGSAATSQLWDEFLDHAPDESVKNVRRCNRGKASEKKQVMTFIKQFTVNTSLIFERKLTDAQFFEGQHRAVRPQEFSIHFCKKKMYLSACIRPFTLKLKDHLFNLFVRTNFGQLVESLKSFYIETITRLSCLRRLKQMNRSPHFVVLFIALYSRKVKIYIV